MAMYTMDSNAAMHRELALGERVEMDEELWWYYLEVLPPVHMRYRATLCDGTQKDAAFGFAEGAELVTAFWRDGWNGETHAKYFAQRTTERNRC